MDTIIERLVVVIDKYSFQIVTLLDNRSGKFFYNLKGLLEEYNIYCNELVEDYLDFTGVFIDLNKFNSEDIPALRSEIKERLLLTYKKQVYEK